jgi:exonuclease V gamma subunit
MLSCKQVTEQAEEYLNKNLTFRQKVSAKIHLMVCKNCRRYIIQYEITKRVLKALLKMPKYDNNTPAEPVNHDKCEKIWQKIQQKNDSVKKLSD